MSNRSQDCSIENSQSNTFGDEADGRACVLCLLCSPPERLILRLCLLLGGSSSLRKWSQKS
jgi:hypothetical protein